MEKDFFLIMELDFFDNGAWFSLIMELDFFLIMELDQNFISAPPLFTAIIGMQRYSLFYFIIFTGALKRFKFE